MAGEPLLLRPEPAARERLRALFLIRAASAAALLLPTLACTGFLWMQAKVEALPELLPDGSASIDIGPNLYAVVWPVWAPLAVLSLAAGAALAGLAWRAFDVWKREYHLTAQALERRGPSGRACVPWSQVARVEAGADITLFTPQGRWRIEASWLGRDRMDEVFAFVSTRLPKERIAGAPSGTEAAMAAALRALPKLFAVLVAAIATAMLYWIFLR